MYKPLLVLVFFFLISAAFPATEPLEVLTINVRFGSANDGEDRWTKRREAMMDIVKSRRYDFIGGQEVVVSSKRKLNQFQFMCDKLPQYGVVYRSREKDANNGEGTPVFYRKDRWQLDETEQGTYWLSDTPEVPGSVTWEEQSICPRCVTGGLFHEKDSGGKLTGKSVYVYSTHFDHVGEVARQKAANLVLQRIAERKDTTIPAILVGDLNAGEQSAAVRFLKGDAIKFDGEEKQPPLSLLDSFRVVHPDAADVATYNGFKKHNPRGSKIDYILTTPGLKATEAEIIRTKTPSGRYPTDHYPVRAVLEF